MNRYGVAGTIVIAAMAFLAGCSSDGGMSDVTSERARLAAYAARAQYPREAELSRDLPAGVVINGDEVKIVNFSNRRIDDVNIWINGGYVRHEASLPANGILTLPKSYFYDGTGRTLSSQDASINKVEIESGRTLYELWGPVRE